MSTLSSRHAAAATTAPPTGDQVWRALTKASFAVVSHVTPAGEPRSSGVVYTVVDHKLLVVVGRDSWKARHIAANGHVAVTVPVRRGGLMSLVFPIPPAVISFHATAVVHTPGSATGPKIPPKLASLLPPHDLDSVRVIEIAPEGTFLTYGVGVPLWQLRDPAKATGRAPVGFSAGNGRGVDIHIEE